ncbi:MAG TPA: LLM class F420-dependent oxidoreductase [Jatrophihabitans sp.]|jgi:F420-dependent oxidoreductase-like protein|uniref:LLM class F420-dependent oxidoreductase n=1 Tax=Jatrophihabitans sp. TaxID=1932789 RepID=UPI002EE14EF0
MRLRVFTEPQQGADYEDLLRVAQAAESLGFDGFFRSDHYLSMGDATGLPGPSDAWTTLAGLARETSRIRLGTLVSPATFRLPGPLAITVAQVDQMSGGRVELGFGAGWFSAEHTAYGIAFPDVSTRYDLFAEQLAIIDGLWQTPTGQRFDFAGEHYRLQDSPALPKPVQQPRVPIILGGAGKRRSAALAAAHADEYNSAFAPVNESGQVFDRVRTAVAEAGRPADSMTYSVAQIVCVGRTDAELRRRAEALGRDLDELRANGLAGSPAEVVDKLGEFAGVGASRAYLQLMDLTDSDQLELIAAEVAPQL